MNIIFTFASRLGALAQLARVSDWQSEGHGFDSRTLHAVERTKAAKAAFFVLQKQKEAKFIPMAKAHRELPYAPRSGEDEGSESCLFCFAKTKRGEVYPDGISPSGTPVHSTKRDTVRFSVLCPVLFFLEVYPDE